MAGEDFQRLAVLIEANTKSYAKAMTRLQADTTRAIRASTKSIASLDASLSRLGGRVTRLAGMFGVAFSATYLVNFIKNAAKAGEAIGDTAEMLGITAEKYQELAYAADQSGTSQESLVTAFKGMTKFLGEVERGSSSAIAELKNLGISLDDIKGKSPDEVFTLLLDRIGKLTDPLQRNAALMKYFGKSGQEMAQLASMGAEGIDKLTQRARDLGVVVSEESIQKSRDAADAMADIGAAGAAAGVNMAAAFLPAIEALRDVVTSQAFQDGMTTAAKNVGTLVEFISKLDPKVLQILLAAAAGYAVGGPLGAAAGAVGGASFVGTNMAIDALGDWRGTRAAPKGDRINSGRPQTSMFNDADFAPPSVPPALAAAVKRKQSGVGAGAGGGGAGFGQDEVAAQQKAYEALAASIQLTTTNLGATARQQEINNAVARLGAEATDDQKASIAQLAGALYDQQVAMERTAAAADFFKTAMFDAFMGILNRTQTVAEALGHILEQLAEALLRMALLGQGPFGGGGGGLFGAVVGGVAKAFGFAGGGTVSGGKPIMVGERGPEIFTPRTSGSVTPKGGNLLQQLMSTIKLQIQLSGDLDQRIQQVSGPVSVQVVRQSLGEYERARRRGPLTGAASAGLIRAG